MIQCPMKKLLIIQVILIFSSSALIGQFTKIGGGLAFSSGFKFHNMDYESNQSGHFAAFLKGIYEISPQLHVSPSYTFFYPHTTKSDNEKRVVSSMMFDINGHYVFNSTSRLDFYGLAGLDILIAWKNAHRDPYLPVAPPCVCPQPYKDPLFL